LLHSITTANSPSRGGGSQQQQIQNQEQEQDLQQFPNITTPIAVINFNKITQITPPTDQHSTTTPTWLYEERKLLNLHRNQGTDSIEEPLRKYIKNTKVLVARLLRINELYMTDPVNAEIQLTRVIVGWKHLIMIVKPSIIQRYNDGAYMYLLCAKYVGDEMIGSRENSLHRHILNDLLEMHGELSPTYVNHIWMQTIETCTEDIPSTRHQDFEHHLPFEVKQYIRQAKRPPDIEPPSATNRQPTTPLGESVMSNINNETAIPSLIARNIKAKLTLRKTTNSNSDSSRTDSEDDQDTDTSSDVYNKNGNRLTTPTYDTSFYVDRKRRNQQSYRLTRIHKKLSEQAKSYQLPTFSLTRGTINQRKAFFRT
jgi:hypothetical protein